MIDFFIKKLSYDLSSNAGLAFIGKYFQLINITSLVDKLFPVRSGTSNSDILKCFIGLLTLGKNDFDAIENFRQDSFFKRALNLFRVPSSATLRQRLDAHAAEWFELFPKLNLKLLSSRIGGKPIDFGTLPCGYTPIDCDTFPMDNSQTKKEAVGRTYAGVDGYCPFAAYLATCTIQKCNSVRVVFAKFGFGMFNQVAKQLKNRILELKAIDFRLKFNDILQITDIDAQSCLKAEGLKPISWRKRCVMHTSLPRKLPCATYESESMWKCLKRKTQLLQAMILKEWMTAHLV